MSTGVAESGAAVQCLKLFQLYPFHNLLHHQVSCRLQQLAARRRCMQLQGCAQMLRGFRV